MVLQGPEASWTHVAKAASFQRFTKPNVTARIEIPHRVSRRLDYAFVASRRTDITGFGWTTALVASREVQ
jgi:hypothetical protein